MIDFRGNGGTVYALAIQGGGAKGSFGVGVVETLCTEAWKQRGGMGVPLERERHPFDVVGGTSIGATIAAAIAPGDWRSVRRAVSIFTDNVFRDGAAVYRKPAAWWLRFAPWWKSDRPSLWDADAARGLIRRYIEYDRARWSDVSLIIPALDMVTGRILYLPERFTQEELERFTYGSAAFPFLFQPVPHGGAVLVDAGVVEATPFAGVVKEAVRRARVDGRERITVVVVLHSRLKDELAEAPRTLFDMGKRLASLALREIARNDLGRVNDRNALATQGGDFRTVDVWIVEPETHLGDSMDFKQARMLARYEAGKQAALKVRKL